MTKTFLSLLLLALVVPLYVTGNLILVAWIRRRASNWLRGAKLFVLRQVRPLTAVRFRITAFGQVLAMIVLAVGIRHRLEIIELSLLLIGYVIMASALTLSLLAQMPVFTRIASDAFMRPILLVAPVVLAYLCRGYSAMWIDETLGFSAENAPLAHFAGTFMMAGFAVAILVMIIAVAFEFAMIVTPSLPTGNSKRRRVNANEPKPALRAWWLSLFSAKVDISSPEHCEWRRAARTMRLIVTFALSFMGCMLVSQAALVPFRSGLGKVVLSTIAFDFDAAPAIHCALATKQERDDAAGDQPKLKALPLSTSQEKAILVRRSTHLFDPILLHDLNEEKGRTLIIERPVACFEPAANTAELR